MKSRRLMLLLLACLLLLSFELRAEEPLKSREVKAVILKNFRPVSFIDKQTEAPAGFAVDLLDAIAIKTNLHVKYLLVDDWADAEAALRNGTADLCPIIAATKERKSFINFTAPTETSTININVRSKTSGIEKLADIKGRSVGVIEGSQAYNLVKDTPGIDLHKYDLFQIAIMELLSGRIDAFIAPDHVVQRIAKEAGIDSQIKSITPPLAEFKRAIGVSKLNPALFQLLESPTANFVLTSEYQKIYSKWYGNPKPFWTATRVATYMGGSFAVILMLLAHLRYRSTNRINQRLRESEQKFKGIFDQTTQLVGLLDHNGMLIEVNQTALDMVGASINDVKNRLFSESPWWAHDPELKEKLKKAIDEACGGKLVRFPATHLTREGKLRHIDFSIKPVFDDNGELFLLIPEGKDVTERVETEIKLHEQAILLEQEIAERQQTQEELNVINESLEERIASAIDEIRDKDSLLLQQSRQTAMGEVLTNIAHQWRQPLNNIAVYIQNMQYLHRLGELTDDEMDQDISSVMDILKYMSHTIDDFRKFFHEERTMVVFPLRETIDRSLGLISAGLTSGNINVTINGENDLKVMGFPNEYAQVLMNILYNARDALMERHIADPQIDIWVKREGERSVLTVTDNGGGISDELLPHIFEPYVSTKGATQGTGIGLYMAKTIIEKHMGGKLTARNTLDGAEFRITL